MHDKRNKDIEADTCPEMEDADWLVSRLNGHVYRLVCKTLQA